MWIWWLWWQSNTIHSAQHFLVAIASPSVEKLCRAIVTIVRSYYYFAELLLQLLCGATYTFTTIVQSFYYCAEPLLLPLCRASTLVQSFYYYSCAGREGTVSPIISRWRRIATTDQKQLKTMKTQQCYWQQCNVYGEKNIAPSKNVCYTLCSTFTFSLWASHQTRLALLLEDCRGKICHCRHCRRQCKFFCQWCKFLQKHSFFCLSLKWKPWLSNSKFAISGSFQPGLSVPKVMFLVPENKKRDKF